MSYRYIYDRQLFFRGFWRETTTRCRAYLKKSIKNPQWLLMSILGRFIWVRFLIRQFSQFNQIQKYQIGKSELFPLPSDVTTITTILKKEGLYSGIELPKCYKEEILDFAYSTNCYGNLDPKLGFIYAEKAKVEAVTGNVLFGAQYFNSSILCPAICNLGHEPQLLEIAAHYLGAEPIFTGSRLWWNFVVDHNTPYDSTKTITFYHYDLDDYLCLRFFFYLTDVGDQDGPHICIRGSHNHKSLSHMLSPIKRLSDQEVIDFYGSEKIVTICGKSGFGFIEDTFCFHKATRPLCHDRLMLQIQFAIHDYQLHHDLKEPALLKKVL